jgi:hypothetical protein
VKLVAEDGRDNTRHLSERDGRGESPAEEKDGMEQFQWTLRDWSGSEISGEQEHVMDERLEESERLEWM